MSRKSQQLKISRVNRWQTLIAALLDAGAEMKSESGILDKVFSSWALQVVTTDRVERIKCDSYHSAAQTKNAPH